MDSSLAKAAGSEFDMSALAWDAPLDGYAAGAAPRSRLVLVPAPTEPRRSPGGLRVTRRGWVVVAALLLVVAGALGVFGQQGAGAAAPLPVVTVQIGQTLGEIAAAELPGLSLDAAITRLRVANNLSTADIAVVQRLVIPRR